MNNEKYQTERKANRKLTPVGDGRAVLILHNFNEKDEKIIQDFFWFEQNRRYSLNILIKFVNMTF